MRLFFEFYHWHKAAEDHTRAIKGHWISLGTKAWIDFHGRHHFFHTDIAGGFVRPFNRRISVAGTRVDYLT